MTLALGFACAAIFAMLTQAVNAAPITPDQTIAQGVTWAPGERDVLGGIAFLPPPGSQIPVNEKTVEFQLTNEGTVAWKSFFLDADFVDFSNFHGPAGSFGIIGAGTGGNSAGLNIGGIHTAVGETLQFLLHVERTASFVTSTGFFGTPGDTDIPSPVPLPAAAWLLLGGLAGLGAVARKRSA